MHSLRRLLLKVPEKSLIEYLIFMCSLVAAINLSDTCSPWPPMAILRPLLQDFCAPTTVIIWQVGYLVYTGFIAIHTVRAENLFNQIKDPAKLRSPLAALFVIMAWSVTMFMHRYEQGSLYDQLLLFPPVVALVLWFQSKLTSRWLASFVRG